VDPSSGGRLLNESAFFCLELKWITFSKMDPRRFNIWSLYFPGFK
jgi:hypothetical protein